MNTATSPLARILRGRAFLACLGAATLGVFGPAEAMAQEAETAAPQCQIQFLTDEALTGIIEEKGFNFDSYDALCDQLRANNLAVEMLGRSGSGNERTVAWAAMRLLTADTLIPSPFTATNTRMVDDATGELGDDLLMEAVDFALENLAQDFASHLAAMRAEETRLAAIFGGG